MLPPTRMRVGPFCGRGVPLPRTSRVSCTSPSRSTKFSFRAVFASSVTLARPYWNPGAATCSSYRPATSDGKEYSPLAVVVPDALVPDCTLVRVTCTPGTTPPAGSYTRPETLAAWHAIATRKKTHNLNMTDLPNFTESNENESESLSPRRPRRRSAGPARIAIAIQPLAPPIPAPGAARRLRRDLRRSRLEGW